jgi:hypothetical protein
MSKPRLLPPDKIVPHILGITLPPLNGENQERARRWHVGGASRVLSDFPGSRFHDGARLRIDEIARRARGFLVKTH